MNRRSWVYVALGGAAVLAALGWAFAPRPIDVELGSVRRGAFVQTIDEDGRTRLADRYVVAAPLAGRLVRIALREGDAVEAGQVVATLQPALPRLLDERELREAQARLDGARADVRYAQAQLEAAEVARSRAGTELQRSEQLARDGFVSASRLDTDRLALQAADKQRDAAAQARQVAQHGVAQAQAALDAMREPGAVRALALRAPVGGRVLRVAQTSETPVAAGAALVEIGDTRRLEVVAELLTAEALRAQPGSRVVIERWGGAPLQGRVRLVEPAAFTKVSALGVEEQRVEVVIDIDSPPDEWRALGDGYRVEVRVVALAADDVLLVPVAALFPLPSAQSQAGDGDGNGNGPPGMAVFVFDAGRAKQRAIDIVARNAGVAWVRGGLQAGESVVVYAPPSVSDGARVRERKP